MKKLLLFMGVLVVIGIIVVGCGNSVDNADNTATDNSATENNAENESANNEVGDNTSNENTTESDGNHLVVVQGDTINSHEVEDAICVVNSRFEQGWRMVFRASVTDAETGEAIDDAEVKVVLEDGQEFEMEYGDHGTDDVETMLYTIAWSIPDDYPTGTLDYKYVATVNGEEYEYEPFDVDLSKMTIIEGEEG